MAVLTLIDGALRSDGNALVLGSTETDPCCCNQCAYVVCISVIDEDSENVNRDADWVAFRAAWPSRKFFLLQPYPSGTGDPLLTPAGWDGIGPIAVSRDNGNVGQRSDWYAACNLAVNLSVGGKIALFIDNSGSMTTATVRASYDFFQQRLAARVVDGVADPVTFANGRLITVTNGAEAYILPHISFEDCPAP